MDIEKRRKAINNIRENIARHGFHIYAVTGGGTPHFGYTIGLTELLGAELILAGAYYYQIEEVPKIIRGIVAELQPPVSWNNLQIKAEPWGAFTLREVEASWANALMLGASDYYQRNNLQAYQIVPDEAHWTVDVPNLTEPWSSTHSPGWRWVKEEWTFSVPKESMALTNLKALRGERITEVMRWEEDEWEIFAGAGEDTTEAERRVVPLGVLLEADATLLPANGLAVGTGLWRDADSEWHDWKAS